jgi:riboflavin synthase
MFTGIVEEVGKIGDLQVGGDQASMRIEAQKVLAGVIEGDSINVDGVCLTVVSLDGQGFTVGLAPETLRRTAFSEREVGAAVNLERAARVGDRLGGHYVQGHIDGVARIVERTPDADSLVLWFEPPEQLLPYIVEKGFVGLDGISLTVAKRTGARFSVVLVAYTQEHVALVTKQAGELVNIEVDVIAKYVENLLQGRLQDQWGQN